MNICDFLPTFIDFDKDTEKILGSDLVDRTSLYHKKEYQRYKLEKVEESPKFPGQYMNHQLILSQFLSANTPYSGILVMHEPGTGKTCLSISIIEKIRNEASTSYKGALVLMKGDTLIRNYKKELVNICTDDKYKMTGKDGKLYGYGDDISEIDEMTGEVTQNKISRGINKKIAEYYDFQTFDVFSKILSDMKDNDIKKRYSNMVIVIDEAHHIRITDTKDKTIEKEIKDRYNNLFRMLHVVQNVKIILMTGTPMVDKPSEIASLMNLILPLKDTLPTGDDFDKKYMITDKNGSIVVNPEKENELREKLYGKVSFLRSMQSTVKREFIGQPLDLKHFNQFVMEMSPNQKTSYKDALDKDKTGKGIYINSREANLFVFPDGTYGREGFEKYMKAIKKGKKTIVQGKDILTIPYKDKKDKLKVLSSFSIKYATCIKMLLEKEGNHFVYMDFVDGSGAVVFAELLEKVFGFNRYAKNSSGGKNTFALLTSKTSADINNILSVFNNNNNVMGDKIKIIIGTQIVSEGFTFKNVQHVHILTPHWNFSETDQAIARAFRLSSHTALINYNESKGKPSPTVSIYLYTTIVDENDVLERHKFSSIDRYMYKFCEDKDISIKSIEYLLKTISFDCRLTKARNKLSPTLNLSRNCEYQPCDYVCYQDEEESEAEQKIDYSTYNLYYDQIDIMLLIDHFKKLFAVKSYYTIEELYTECNNVPKYLVIKTIVFCKENKIVINDSKGLKMFLYYEDNFVFLSFLIENVKFLDTFYSTHIPLQLEFNLDKFILKAYNNILVFLFTKLKDEKDKKSRNKILFNFPNIVLQMVLQYCILSKFLKIKVDKNTEELREFIIKNLDTYYKNTPNFFITASSAIQKIVEKNKNLKCLDKRLVKSNVDIDKNFAIGDFWKDCPINIKFTEKKKDERESENDSDSESESDKDSESERDDESKSESRHESGKDVEKEKVLTENIKRFGYEGFDDKEKNKFKIKKIIDDVTDQRNAKKGYVCSTTNKINLIEAIHLLKMNPESNKIKDQTESNVKMIRDKMVEAYPKIKDLIEKMNKEDLLRVNYWDGMTVKDLCPIIRQFFKKINIFRE
jgi:hypothetical protein